MRNKTTVGWPSRVVWGRLVFHRVTRLVLRDELLVVHAVAPLPRVDHPEDEGQHHRRRDHHQPDVHPLAVPLQAGAVVPVDGRERVAHERAVLQLNQERPVLVQPLAHRHARRHLTVDLGGHAPRRGADLGS